jgi:2-polyprenyl-6-methoxyphenol hydroxylase-like FAD-dependent oxidoreductase
MLATEFSRDGVDVLLIERLKTRTFFTKALGVTPRTLKSFACAGNPASRGGHGNSRRVGTV